jgi:hypothetical protein
MSIGQTSSPVVSALCLLRQGAARLTQHAPALILRVANQPRAWLQGHRTWLSNAWLPLGLLKFHHAEPYCCGRKQAVQSVCTRISCHHLLRWQPTSPTGAVSLAATFTVLTAVNMPD